MRPATFLLVLSLAAPAAAQDKWFNAGFDDAAKSFVALALKDRGLEVDRHQVVIVKDRSEYPQLRKRTGTAAVSWEVQSGGARVKGVVQVRGNFGLFVGDNRAYPSGMIITESNDKASGLFRHHSDRIKARNQALREAKRVFQRQVSNDLRTINIALPAEGTRATLLSKNLDSARYRFMNTVRAPDGTRLVEGEGQVGFTWNDGRITGFSPVPVTITKNRLTRWNQLKNLFRGQRLMPPGEGRRWPTSVLGRYPLR